MMGKGALGASARWVARPAVRRWAIGAGIVLLAAVPLWIWHAPILALVANRAQLVAAVRGAGPAGPLILIGLTVAQVILAPLPGQLIDAVGGYLYGFWWGSFYCWVGLTLGSILAMVLARVAGRPLLNRILDCTALDKLDRLAAGKGLFFFWMVFLLPFMPDDLICFLAGLTPLPLPALILVAAVGRIPGLLTAVWAGTEAGQLNPVGWVVAGVLAVASAWVAWRHGDRIQAAMLRFVGRRTVRGQHDDL
jgi:uncharacterized membrane protein YdjX (TVP38/TMEM64 family)